MTIKRTNADDPDFLVLAAALEVELKIRDGDDHAQYAALNKIDFLPHTVVAYIHNEPVGCGALRHYTDTAIEMKRVFVASAHRSKGIATAIISLLEEWAAELGYAECVLETGKNQPEAIQLYTKNGYQVIANFGIYISSENSICFQKHLLNIP